MKSVMTPQQYFNHVAKPDIQRSTFDRSHGYKTTFSSGQLIPIFLDEALPVDTFNLRTAVFARLATPLKPIMDNIQLDVHYFSVPLRLVWDNFKKFMGEQEPLTFTAYTVPTMTSTAVTGYTEASLFDYMGIPTEIPGLEHSALFTRCYNLIWNEWYRDENLQNSAVVDTDDGPDTPADYIVRPRGLRKDYFASALPFLQKGTAVSIPLAASAPVFGNGKSLGLTNSVNTGGLLNTASFPEVRTGMYNVNIGTAAAGVTFAGGALGVVTSGVSGLVADLSAAVQPTINELRQSFQIQKMLEKDARGGTRYTEKIRAHFGVISPDARLQRPEFLGGTTANVNINPVAQTSEAGTTPQANLAATGTVASSGSGFVKSFTEHEIIIGLASVRADQTYQQGLNRMWSRSTIYDFYWPTLAHLGEQAILNKEIYAKGTANPTQDAAVFGYQERYAEYRYKPSIVTGAFRSNANSGSLDSWHLAYDFAALPALNSTFISLPPQIGRVIAVPSAPEFLMDCYFNLKTARPMPTFATPGLIDHF